jgi:SPP1 gp7 family putative phage head morphogenesis protein
MQDDFLKYAHLVEGRANQLAADMVRELRRAREELSEKIAALDVRMLRGKLAEASYRERKRFLQALKAEIEAVLADTYKRAGNLLYAAGEDVTGATSAFSLDLVGRKVGASVVLPRIGEQTAKAWFESATVDGLVINEWLSKIEAGAAERIVRATRQALLQGMSVREAAAYMGKHGVEASIPGLQGLARTSMLSAMNYAKETSIEANFGDVLTGWRYTATLDGRTCVVCGADDGMFFPKGEARPELPRHFNCRCTYVPVTALESGGVERPAVIHSGRTVQHRDGSTSTAWTVQNVDFFKGSYSQWMRKMLNEDPAFVRSVLGKTRFDLYRSGRLSLDGMRVNNRIKRLAEL